MKKREEIEESLNEFKEFIELSKNGKFVDVDISTMYCNPKGIIILKCILTKLQELNFKESFSYNINKGRYCDISSVKLCFELKSK